MSLINTQYFKLEAEKFKKDKSYCKHAKGTYSYQEYWEDQLDRCINGYQIGDTKITGNHYFYLNFCQIKLTEDTPGITKHKKVGKKTLTFPDFWDGDYEYFWLQQIAANGLDKEDYLKLNLSTKIKEEDLTGGKHMIVAKARRKGFSYKNAAICANRYNTEKNSITIIGAFEKKYLYPTGTMTMVSDYMNFLNEHTGWTKRRQVVDKIDHKRASRIVYINGEPIEKGYKSQVIALTFQNNPDAARGKDASLILFEEGGKFNNLKASYLATKPTVEDGAFTTGQILIYGTGGDMEGGTIDFEDMFYNPEGYNLLAVENKWDEGNNNTNCGFFVPDYVTKPGYIDNDGNSLKDKAKEVEDAKREALRRDTKDRRSLDKHITEYPYCPKEAFLRLTGNIFPATLLLQTLSKLETVNTSNNARWIGDLVLDDTNKVVWKMNSNIRPIESFPIKADDKSRGCTVIYEMPFTPEGGDIPYGMYVAGTDPYAQNESEQSDSLGSTFVVNKITKRIVAEYTGRPETVKEYYEEVRKLLLFYNARCLYENQIKGMFDYFEYMNCTYLLADQPTIIKDILKYTDVERGKGMHMAEGLKDFGEQLIKQWLLEPVEGEVLNVHKIRSIPLLHELIKYNKEGNFDRVIALMMCMYQCQEMRKIQTDIETKPTTVYDSSFWNKRIFHKRKGIRF